MLTMTGGGLITFARMHDIRCPCCTKKLMCVKTNEDMKPDVTVVKDPKNQLIYDAVTRCFSCKTYVGFLLKSNN